MELGGELVPGASAVAGLHDMGNLGKEKLLSGQIRVHPLDGKVFGVAQLAQQPAEGTLDKEPGTGFLIQRLCDQHIEDRRQMIVDLCRFSGFYGPFRNTPPSDPGDSHPEN